MIKPRYLTDNVERNKSICSFYKNNSTLGWDNIYCTFYIHYSYNLNNSRYYVKENMDNVRYLTSPLKKQKTSATNTPWNKHTLHDRHWSVTVDILASFKKCLFCMGHFVMVFFSVILSTFFATFSMNNSSIYILKVESLKLDIF